MMNLKTSKLLLAVGLMSPLAVRTAEASDRRDDVRDAKRELNKDKREAQKELRENLRDADDREDVRDARREYQEDMRDSLREYRDDVDEYWKPGRSVGAVPSGAHRHNWGGRDYYYNNGAFYRRESNGFTTVRPPNGAVVTVLPSGAHIVNKRGEKLYHFGDVHYRQVGPSRFVVVTE